MLNFYSLLPFSALLTNLVFGIFILYIDPKSRLNRLYSLFTLSFAFWALGDFMVFMAYDQGSSLFWAKAASVGSTLSAAFAINFFVLLTKNRLANSKLMLLFYVPAAAFSLLSLGTDLITKGTKPVPWGLLQLRGPLYIPMTLFIVACMVASIILCYMYYRRTEKQDERKQMRIMIIGTSIPLFGGIVTQIVPIIMGFEMIPLSSTLSIIIVVAAALGVMRYRLMTPVSFSIRKKIIVSIMVASIIPLLMLSHVSISSISSLGLMHTEHMDTISNFSINETVHSLEALGAEMVKQKAFDVSNQIGIFISKSPQMTEEQMKNNAELASIAVQRVDKTGYTAVHNNKGINLFHSNPNIIGSDLTKLNLTGFREIVQKSLSQEAYGYYDWKESDGSIRQKYMHCVPVKMTGLVVCATTYIDEFSEPSDAAMKRLNNATKQHILDEKDVQAALLVTIGAMLIPMVAIMIIITYLLTGALSKPILKLTDAMKKISGGNLDVKIEVKEGDEIGQLASSFKQMLEELKTSKIKIEEHSKTLEKDVEDRTSQLEDKVSELERFSKLVIGRELKMVDLKKKLKEVEDKLKSKENK
ncbi:MAG: HAMP domain-containing protein [Candidatus Aenigmarchaeota archaeon]|nr:HAMP domain-containing protein [Candidatus Aenigmarchaeota archaeon]